MITPAEIATKARQHYPQLLRAWLAGRLPQFFPLVIRSNKGSLTTDPSQRTEQLRRLRAGSREEQPLSYTVHWQTVRSARHGAQGVPTRIDIEDLSNYLHLCSLQADFNLFTEQAALIQQQLPALTDWLPQHPEQVTPHTGYWPALLRVCTYFLQNPLPEVYARQVPGVPSKFVEQHTGILHSLLAYLLPADYQRPDPNFARRFGLRTDPPMVRFRLLDSALAAHLGGLTDLAVPQPDFEQLTLSAKQQVSVLVVENKLTFLTLPPLPDTLAVWGSGYAVERLRHCAWLHACPIYYWGDIDLHGFRILAQLRNYFPHTTSVLMDEETYQRHREYAHAGTSAELLAAEVLTPVEYSLYQFLLANPAQNRLEQEHVDIAYASQLLRAAALPPSQQPLG